MHLKHDKTEGTAAKAQVRTSQQRDSTIELAIYPIVRHAKSNARCAFNHLL